MAKNKDKAQSATGGGSETEPDIGNDLDAVFALPLAEFAGARNGLAARLKKAGRSAEAARVKGLGKPTISAWAANQLYWKHRDAFDRLIAASERLRQAQTLQLSGKAADIRGPHEVRREALSHLSRLASALLHDAGHSTTPDTMRRITTTLEALSAYASRPDAPQPGRLIDDVDAPGFEALAALMPGVDSAKTPDRPPPVNPIEPPRQKASQAGDVREPEKSLQRIAVAKASLCEARDALNEARSKARNAAAELEKATAGAALAEKRRREAEERWQTMRGLAEDADRRARSMAAEAERAKQMLEETERVFENATRALESLL